LTLASAFILLFLVIDPLGNIPFYLSALKTVDPARHRVVVIRELLIALFIMVVFLFAGRPLLGVLGISQPALTISGGVVLFLIAIRMVFPDAPRAQDQPFGEPFIVPLAIPYVAGPSVLATEMLLMSRDPARWSTWLTALVLAWLATALILMLGQRLGRVLGDRGMIAIERLMGMVLVAVAVQMFLTGLDEYFR
jgi:multiple antibiotic resistance protein